MSVPGQDINDPLNRTFNASGGQPLSSPTLTTSAPLQRVQLSKRRRFIRAVLHSIETFLALFVFFAATSFGAPCFVMILMATFLGHYAFSGDFGGYENKSANSESDAAYGYRDDDEDKDEGENGHRKFGSYTAIPDDQETIDEYHSIEDANDEPAVGLINGHTERQKRRTVA